MDCTILEAVKSGWVGQHPEDPGNGEEAHGKGERT